MVFLLYLIAGVVMAIINYRTIEEVTNERIESGAMSRSYANAIKHCALIFVALLWPYFALTFIVNFFKYLIKGGNEE